MTIASIQKSFSFSFKGFNTLKCAILSGESLDDSLSARIKKHLFLSHICDHSDVCILLIFERDKAKSPTIDEEQSWVSWKLFVQQPLHISAKWIAWLASIAARAWDCFLQRLSKVFLKILSLYFTFSCFEMTWKDVFEQNVVIGDDLLKTACKTQGLLETVLRDCFDSSQFCLLGWWFMLAVHLQLPSLRALWPNKLVLEPHIFHGVCTPLWTVFAYFHSMH